MPSPANPNNPPQGNQPPGDGGNGSSNGGDPPEPPDGPPPVEPVDGPQSTPSGTSRSKNSSTASSNPAGSTSHTTSEQEEEPRSEEIPMRQGTSRLLMVLVVLALLCGGGYLLFTRGCTTPVAVVVPPVAPSASGAAPIAPPPAPFELTFLTPGDAQTLCTGPAAENQFLVGRANGTESPVVAPLCSGGSEFVGYAPSKARVIADNLIVARSQKLETIWGNAQSYIGADNLPGAQAAKAHWPVSHWLSGKTRVRVRVDGALITVEDPLLVLTSQNGGDTFDMICKPYREMQKSPSETWEAEIWSRCRRGKTATNVAVTQTIVKYVAANPGVTREDFQTATARIAALEEQVKKGGNVVIPPQKVSTEVGSK